MLYRASTLRSYVRNWPRLGVILAMLIVTVASACGPGAAPTPTATAPPPTPTRAAAAPTATPTTAPVTGVATSTPTRAAATVVATPTPTAAPVGPGIRAKEGVKRGGVFRWATSTKPALFDLHQVTTQINTDNQGQWYDGLLRLNPVDGNKTVIPDLASSWELSPDRLSYTYHLRPGVKFHDGSTLTADDVVATYNKIISPPAGVLSPRKDLFAAVTKVEAVDPLTVRFVLKRPSAVVVPGTALGFHVVAQKSALEKSKYDLKTVKDYPGTGPFRQVKWIEGEQAISERFTDYWNKGLPYLDGVQSLETSGANAGAAVLTGKAEYASLSADLIPRVKESKGQFVIYNVQAGSPRTIYTNQKRPFFSDPRVRRAIHLVVNRQAIVEAALAGNNQVAFGGPWMPAGSIWSRSAEELEKMPGYRKDKTADIAEAKKLMAAAGYPNGAKDLDVLSRSATGLQTEIVAPALLEQLSVLGITGKIRTAETSAWAPETARGGFDLSIGFANGIMDDPSANWQAWLTSGAGFNYGGYSNPQLDKIVEQLDLNTDFSQRLALVRQAEAILEEDPPMIFWAWLLQTYVSPSYVKDLYADRFGIYDGGTVRKDTVWLDK